jgi:hypothetical protein
MTKRKKNIFTKWWFWVIVIVLIGIIGSNMEKNDKEKESKQQLDVKQEKEQKKKEGQLEEKIGIGQILQTSYFDVVVNKVSLQSSVKTGNEFADLAREQGNMYLILNVSFKNTDKESRTLISEGSVWINYNNIDYQFDKSETVMLEGWGLFFDQINPLVTKTTNIVYKIPTEIKGPAYWQPGRAKKDQRIFLGNLE